MAFFRLETDQTIEFERRSDAVNELSFALSGTNSPMVEFQLQPGQGVICELPVVMQSDATIETRQWPGVSRNTRLMVNSAPTELAGLTVMARCTGRAGVFDLTKYGGRLLVPQCTFLAAGPGVIVKAYSHYRNIGPAGLDLMLLEGNGWAFLRACGDVKEFKLGPGKKAHVNVAALAAMSATVDFDPLELDDKEGKAGFARLTGPGRVWLQSGAP